MRDRSSASPIGGVVGHAGQHLGDVARLRPACPRRCSLPAMFIRQPRSPASSVSAPVAAMCSAFLLDDGVGDVGILDAERAAEAAADIGVVQLLQLEALRRCASSLRGCALMPSSRRPEQQS